MSNRPLERLLVRLGAFQVARPWHIVLIVLVTLIPSGWLASRLELKTAFSELLPSEKPSVIELGRVNKRLSSLSTLTVVAEGQNAESLKRFVDLVSPKIRELGPEFVVGVDDGSREVEGFFRQNKYLYADLKDIQELRDDVVARYEFEVGKQAGSDLGLDDEEPPALTAEAVEKRFQKKVDEAKKSSKGVDGYYIGEAGKLAAILVRTPLGSGDPKAFELRKKIEDIVAEQRTNIADPSLALNFTGNLITSAEQHRAVKDDLAHVGFWGLAGILSVTLLFFMRMRTLLAMALTIGVGCVWAFGAARLSVGYLNTATGFLVSIIAGNGINFGIMYMARYVEARRDEKVPVAEAVETAHRDTHTATLAAAGAAGIAYGSLAITDFNGFKHFGIIGGVGMVLCWTATYLFLPAFLVLSERYSPMFSEREAPWRAKMKGFYGYPFAFVARSAPRAVAAVGMLLAVAGGVLTYRYFAADPMEYDLANVRNERTARTSAGKLSVRVDKIVGRLGQDGRAVLTERLDQVQPLITELEKRRDAFPADNKPFDRVVSVYDLLPKDQPKKLALLDEIEDRLQRARKRDIIKTDDFAKIREHLPEKRAAIGIGELPEQIVRAFTELNGTRGTIVYIVPTEGKSVYDAHYLMHFADAFREVRLPNGEVIRGTGDPVIFSDMLINIGEDAPKATLLSFLGTLLVILIAFRGKPAGFATLSALALGVVWLIGFLALRHIKLNFLNFVALPITIGIGADYAINVMKRRELDPGEDLYRVMQQTGGAVVLCSLTTQLGYFALLLSINRAVKSFGLAAAAGEITTLLAAVLVLPAFLFWQAKRKRDAQAAGSPPGDTAKEPPA